MSTTSNSVLTMLKADHKKVRALFAEFEDATARKRAELGLLFRSSKCTRNWKRGSSIPQFEQGSRMTR